MAAEAPPTPRRSLLAASGLVHAAAGRRRTAKTARATRSPTYHARWRRMAAACVSTERAVDGVVTGGAAPRRLGRSGGAGAEERVGATLSSMAGSPGPSLSRPLPSTDMSLDTEMCNVCVAYQGSPGTVIEVMVLKAFPEFVAVPHKKLEGAFEAVESSLADIAVLPIENSSTGSFHQSYDLLLSHDLQIVREVQMDVELCLLALPGVQKDDLQTVFSHPQDLAQCELSHSNLGVSKKNVDHGAAGAEIISKKKLRDAGVIGSARAAELYGLNILESDFQDASPNVTRYLVLARYANLPKERGQYKTSIVFGLEEGPGTLYKALGAFWKREINLTKVESRPNKCKPMRILGTENQFNYIFYVDFEASTAEVRAQNALKDLEEIANFLRVLGCYPFSTAI